MTTKKKIGIGIGSLVAIAALAAVIMWLRGFGDEPKPATPSASPTAKLKARKPSNDRFGPRARAQATANVDVGIRTVTMGGSPTPGAKPNAAGPLTVRLAQASATASPDPLRSLQNPTTPTPLPPAPAPPPPPKEPPRFTPLAPAPAPQAKESIIVYSKGDPGKRQIFVRSLEREKDDQLVSSVFDDFGVSLSSSGQKVAYYSNEEGASDAARPRSKLKVVDLATSRVTLIAVELPGAWPVAWSGDGKKLAIPTANSIFIADTTSGTALQVPTAKNPGGIIWAPGDLKFFFQAEIGGQNNDIFEADAITAQARPVIATPTSERQPSVSIDGTKLSFLREQGQGKQSALVVRNLGGTEEQTFAESQPAESYLWNLDLSELIFVKGGQQPRLSKLKGRNLTTLGDLSGVTVVAWDRDYQHAFVLADDDQGKALFSVETTSGEAEKVKAGIPEHAPATAR